MLRFSRAVRGLIGGLGLLCFSQFGWASEGLIEFTSNPIFAVQTNAKGKVRESTGGLSVLLDSLVIRIKDNYKKPLAIRSVSLGLAKEDANKVWNIERYSAKFEVNASLQPGEVREFKDFLTLVPIEGIDSLKDYWLVIDVETATRHHHFSHSPKGVLAPFKP